MKIQQTSKLSLKKISIVKLSNPSLKKILGGDYPTNTNEPPRDLSDILEE